jgi:glycosyltransferase involved in cell wall biosynthesis
VSVLLLYPPALADQYYLRLRDAGVGVSSVASSGVNGSISVGRKLARGLLESFPASQGVVRRRSQEVSSRIAFRYYDQCRLYFEQARADLVHVITPDWGGMVLIRAAHDAGVPVLYQEVGTPFHPPGFETYYQRFTSVLPLCAEVAALSPQLAAECREKLPATNVSVLPILIDDKFDREAVTAQRRADQHVAFGFAARLEHLKGPLVLMDAFAKTHRTRPDIKLHVAGSGSLKRKLLSCAKAHGISGLCEFPGVYTTVEEKGSFMQSLDVFVLPSLTEGTPNGIIEAMAYGLPVISTTVGGIPDLVSDETGILVAPDDVEALAQAMIRLAEDRQLRERMGRAARKRYEKLFSPRLTLPLMLDTYRRITNGNGNHLAHVPPNGNGLLHPWANINL